MTEQSSNEARHNFTQFGASEKRFRGNVRPLSPDEQAQNVGSSVIPEHSRTAVLRTICAWGQEYAQVDASAGQFDTAFAVTQCMSGVATARIAERNLAVPSLCMRTGPSRRLK